MLSTVRRTILDRGLLEPRDHVLVACSGGPDSVAMTDVLAALARELGITLVVASVDHGLRPEAASEVLSVERLASELGLPFRALRVEVPRRGSLPAEARRARYEALAALAQREGATVVAVGHTRDDQAETVLERILRGASIEGLAGIAPRREDGVVRPLIDCSRADVLAHLGRRGLGYVSDPSNDDRAFLRARLRAEVLPLLTAIDPAVAAHLAALADDARAAAEMLKARGDAELARIEGSGGRIDAGALLGTEEAARRTVVRRLVLRATGRFPSRKQIEAVERCLGGAGEVLLGRGLSVRVEDGALVVGPATTSRTRSSREGGLRNAPRPPNH